MSMQRYRSHGRMHGNNTCLAVHLCEVSIVDLWMSRIITIGHEIWPGESIQNLLVDWQVLNIQPLTEFRKFTHLTTHVEVVCEGDAMARSHLKNFVFAVAVEGSPLDALAWSRPVKGRRLTPVTHDKLPAFVLTWETHYE
jgi:hypothetical protein